MGTIAEKLTYLNTTKIKLRDSLNKFGSSILSTDTFRSYDTKLNDIYDKLPKVTATGQGLTISNVQNGLLDDFKMIGVDLEQDTTTGKNLFDKDNANIITAYIGDSYNWTFSGSAICYRINCKPNTSYTISCANSNETIFRGSVTDSEDIPTSGNNLSIYSTVRRTNNSPITVNTGANAKYVLVQLSNTQYLTSLETLQVEEGSSVTSYEPYTGGIASPNPDYPQEIKVVEGRQVITDKGKNLFDKNNANILTGFLADGGTFNSTTGYKTLYISCNNSSTYTIQKTSGSFFRVAEFENIPANGDNWITRTKDDNANVITFTTTTGNYLAVTYFKSSDTVTEQEMLNSIQIEENSSATDYEPYYNPVSYNIDLHGKNYFDGQYEDGYYNNSNGKKNTTQDPYGCRSTNKNEVKPNENYIISVNNVVTNLSIRLFYYDINRNFLSTDTTTTGIFTTPNDCYFIAWHSSALKQNYPDGIPNMMIENNSQVTSYEDYYDYELAKTPNTNYKNRIYKSNGNWYFEKNVEKIILDGSEEWGYGSISGVFYTTSITNYAISSNVPYSNYYTGVSNVSGASNMGQQSNNTIGFINVSGQTTPRFYIKDTRYTSASDISNLKVWLSSNNIEVWYILDNSVTTQITNTTLINQLEAISVHTGTNIITISNDNNIIPEIEITRLKELEKLA